MHAYLASQLWLSINISQKYKNQVNMSSKDKQWHKKKLKYITTVHTNNIQS